METLGARLRRLREEAGLSQAGLGSGHLSTSYVSLIESGRRVPSARALEHLAERLGTTVAHLRDGIATDQVSQVRLEVDLAQLDAVRGEPRRAVERLSALDQDVLPQDVRAQVQLAMGRALRASGDLEAASSLLEDLVTTARRAGLALVHAEAATLLLVTYLEAGDLHRAVDVGEQALAVAEEAGIEGTDEQVRLASSLVWACVARGDLLYAQHRAEAALAVAERSGSRRARGSVYWNAAIVAEGRGDVSEAHRLTTRALALLGEDTEGLDVSRLRLHLGWLLLRGDAPDPEAALEQLARAQAGLEVAQSVPDLAGVEVERGRAHLMAGRLDDAETAARRALEILGEGPRAEAAHARLVLGDVQEARGDVPGALATYRDAVAALSLMGAGRQAAQAMRGLGDRLLRCGDAQAAARAYAGALSEAGISSPAPAPAHRA